MEFTSELSDSQRRAYRKSLYRAGVGTNFTDPQMELALTEGTAGVVEEHSDTEPKSSIRANKVEISRRVYPHAYDPDGPHGPVLVMLREAAIEAQRAISAYNDADMGTVGSSLSVIAALMKKCYPNTAFNPALGAVVSFVRRATLTKNPEDSELSELMALTKSLQRLADMPLISLEDSADMVDELERHKWVGENGELARFITALFEEAPMEVSGIPVSAEKSA